MAYTSHGHYILGSKKTGVPPKHKTRCYGDHRCVTCKNDISAYWKKHGVKPEKEEGADTVDIIRQRKAQTLVENYIVDGLPSDQKSVKVQAFVLKLTRIGDDWKSLVTSNVDEMIYEVVYLAKYKAYQIKVFSPIDLVTIRDGD